MRTNIPQPHGRVHGGTLVLLGAMMLFGGSVFAQTPIPITVDAIKPIEIGSISPGEVREISHSDPAAARFSISGPPNTEIDLSIAVEELAALATGTSDNQSTSLTLLTTGYNCAYSVDFGATWVPFETEEPAETILLPTPSTTGDPGVVLLRVGGTVTANSDQQRGPYLGGVVVSARYHSSVGGTHPGAQTGSSRRGIGSFDEFESSNQLHE